MIDIHCHILPETDDGAENLEESLSMARRAVADGIHTIVATPHTFDGTYDTPAREVRRKVACLQESLRKNNIMLTLCSGADVHLCPRLLERVKAGEAATINDTGKYILLELPHQTIPAGIKEEIFSLKVSGITPIISHPERHPIIQQDIRILYELIQLGALCQVTAMSVTGEFGEITRRCAEQLLVRRLVHIIASDAHSSAGHRPPLLASAVEAAAEVLGSFEEARRMVTEIPSAVLAGEVPVIADPV